MRNPKPPIRQCETKRQPQLVAVQTGIGGAARRRWIGRGGDRVDLGGGQAVLARPPKNLARKAEPARLAAANRVIDAPASCIRVGEHAIGQAQYGSGKIWSIGWRTQLVFDYADVRRAVASRNMVLTKLAPQGL